MVELRHQSNSFEQRLGGTTSLSTLTWNSLAALAIRTTYQEFFVRPFNIFLSGPGVTARINGFLGEKTLVPKYGHRESSRR
jgi:hypothetical protein